MRDAVLKKARRDVGEQFARMVTQLKIGLTVHGVTTARRMGMYLFIAGFNKPKDLEEIVRGWHDKQAE